MNLPIMRSFHFFAMPYRTADKLPGAHDPATEELHDRKKKWADDGCLPADPMTEALRKLEKDALDGKLSIRKIANIRERLKTLKHIEKETSQAILAILDKANVRDARQEIMGEMERLAEDGELSDDNKNIIRKMVEVQMKEGNLHAVDYIGLLDMLGFTTIKG